MVAADLVNSALFKQLRDLSIGSRELMAQGVDIADVDGPLKTIRDRLIIGLSEVKKRRYLWGIQGQQLQLAPEQIAERFTQIHQQTKESIDTALEFMGKTKNQDVMEAIIEAFSGADNIHNWTDLDAFMRRRLHGLSNKNQTLKELGGVFVNSVLSGLKTSQRALVGTGEIMGLQSLGKGVGGALLGDLDTARAVWLRTSHTWKSSLKLGLSSLSASTATGLVTLLTCVIASVSTTPLTRCGQCKSSGLSNAEPLVTSSPMPLVGLQEA